MHRLVCSRVASNKECSVFSKKCRSNKVQSGDAVPCRHTRGRQPSTYSAQSRSTGSTAPSMARMRTLSMDRAYCCHGLPSAVSVQASSFPYGGKHRSKERGCSGTEGRNTQSPAQESDTSGPRFGGQQRLVQPLFRCSEERRRTPSYFGPESVKQISTNLQVQDVNAQTTSDCDQSGGLVCNHRSNRRLLSCSDTPRPQAVSKVCIPGHGLRIPSIAVRSVSRPPHLQQMCRGGVSSSPRERRTHFSVLGRLGSDSQLQRAGRDPAVASSVSHSSTGVFSEFPEKLANPEPAVFVSRTGNMLRYQPSTSVRAQGGRVLPLPRSVSVGTQTASSDNFTADWHDGVYDRSSAARAVEDASVSALDSLSPAVSVTSPPEEADDNTVLLASSPPVEGARPAVSGLPDRQSVFSQGGVHRCLSAGLGGSVRRCDGERGLVASSAQTSHQPPGAAGGFLSSAAFLSRSDRPACSDQNRQHNGGFLYKQAGRNPFTSPVKTVSLSVAVVQCSFPICQSHPCTWSHEPGCRPSLQRGTYGERMEITPTGGGSDMGTVWQGRSGPLCFQSKHTLPSVLLHNRPECNAGHGCTSSPMAQHAPVCISPSGIDTACSGEGASAGPVHDPSGPSVASEVMVRRDNQSAGSEALEAPCTQGSPLSSERRGASPAPRTVAAACLPVERSNLLAKGLPPNVVATIQSARASSTRGLYAYKWRAFEQWCQNRDVLPFQCSVVDVLTFLQELLDKGLSFSTIKVYLAAISACHVGFDSMTPGAHPLVMRFLKGVRRLRPTVRSSVPSWDLSLVLEAFCGPPFEPIESVDMKFLSYKTALLLALCSAKRVGDLHALSVHPSCTQFSCDGSKVTLRPNVAYLPKVIPAAYSSMAFELLSFCPPPFASEEQRRLHSLCPVRALRTYIDRTQTVRSCDQLFVCFANPARGKALSKQRLSHWIVEAISLAYGSRGLPLPHGVRAHSTRGMATSWALFKGVPISDVCAAASWSSPHTFVRFYRLDVTAPSVAQSVLSAGSTVH